MIRFRVRLTSMLSLSQHSIICGTTHLRIWLATFPAGSFLSLQLEPCLCIIENVFDLQNIAEMILGKH